MLYLTIGLLALWRAAQWQGGATTDQRGALTSISDLPFGSVLVVVLGIGLAGYAVWQLVRATLDPEHQGTAAKGLAKRGGYLLSALSYVGLAIAATLPDAAPGLGGAGTTRDWTARLLDVPGGQILVGLVGAVIIGIAIKQVHTALTSAFMRQMALTDLGQQRRKMVERVGQVGIVARAAVFAVIGGFFLQAAWRAAPGKTGGLKDALNTFASAPYGRVLLAVVAAGLVAYGVYCLVLAVYRRIHIQTPSSS
ncbi:MAG: hypothetical protein JWQ08_1284 [Deinococcus sp.]|nr:hypothetical protein [Deinococcus sp.]